MGVSLSQTIILSFTHTRVYIYIYIHTHGFPKSLNYSERRTRRASDYESGFTTTDNDDDDDDSANSGESGEEDDEASSEGSHELDVVDQKKVVPVVASAIPSRTVGTDNSNKYEDYDNVGNTKPAAGSKAPTTTATSADNNDDSTVLISAEALILNELNAASDVVSYYSLDGDDWITNRGWLSPGHECTEWYSTSFDGICNDDSQYVKLSLATNGSRGTLPVAELALLSKLEVIDFEGNGDDRIDQRAIKGGISSEIGTLINLRYLSLRNNDLRFEVPSELGALTNLEHLDLSTNRFVGPFDGAMLSGLQKLTNLQLQSNPFTGTVPSELSLLSNLDVVRIDNTQLQGEVPIEVCDTFRQTLPTFYLDCSGNNPQVSCLDDAGPCCTYCCESNQGAASTTAGTEGQCECAYDEDSGFEYLCLDDSDVPIVNDDDPLQ